MCSWLLIRIRRWPVAFARRSTIDVLPAEVGPCSSTGWRRAATIERAARSGRAATVGVTMYLASRAPARAAAVDGVPRRAKVEAAPGRRRAEEEAAARRSAQPDGGELEKRDENPKNANGAVANAAAAAPPPSSARRRRRGFAIDAGDRSYARVPERSSPTITCLDDLHAASVGTRSPTKAVLVLARVQRLPVPAASARCLNTTLARHHQRAGTNTT